MKRDGGPFADEDVWWKNDIAAAATGSFTVSGRRK